MSEYPRKFYVIDNGRDYSDHSLYFIETDQPREVVEVVRQLAYPDGKVLGYGSFEWWEGGVFTLKELIKNEMLYAGSPAEALALRALALKLPEDLQAVIQFELDNL